MGRPVVFQRGGGAKSSSTTTTVYGLQVKNWHRSLPHGVIEKKVRRDWNQLIDHKPNCFGAWLDSSHNPMVPVKKPTFAAREEHGAVLDTTPLIDVMKKVAREMVRAPT
jgi:hypothetical protein